MDHLEAVLPAAAVYSAGSTYLERVVKLAEWEWDAAEQHVELLGEDPGCWIEQQTFVSAVLGCLGAHSPASGWWCRPSGCCRGASFRSTSTARTAT